MTAQPPRRSMRALQSDEATLASLTSLLAASGNLYEGVDNALTARYALSPEPLGRKLAALWAET